MFKRILTVLVCIASVSFLMTGQYSYQAKPPTFIGSVAEPFHHEGVHIQAKRYSSSESKKYLDRNVHKHGVHPVQVTIQNNTQKSYLLSKDGVDISHLHSNEVVGREYMRSIPRSIAFKVAGFLFWPNRSGE